MEAAGSTRLRGKSSSQKDYGPPASHFQANLNECKITFILIFKLLDLSLSLTVYMTQEKSLNNSFPCEMERKHSHLQETYVEEQRKKEFEEHKVLLA